jgi:hypothetical protein
MQVQFYSLARRLFPIAVVPALLAISLALYVGGRPSLGESASVRECQAVHGAGCGQPSGIPTTVCQGTECAFAINTNACGLCYAYCHQCCIDSVITCCAPCYTAWLRKDCRKIIIDGDR